MTRPSLRWIAICSMWLAACDRDGKTGSGPEEDNPAYGRIFTSGGEPAAGSKVGFWPVDAWPTCPSTDAPKPEPAYSAVTDESGRYRMDSIPDGQFNMIAEWNGEMLFRGPINPRSPVQDSVKDTLQAAASLVGGIGLPFVVDPGAFCVQVKGTPFSSRVGLDDRFSFDSLPAGLLDIRLESWLPHYDAVLFRKNLSAGERDSLDMESGYTSPLGKTFTLEASHDSLSGNVTLKWERTARPGTLYDVYRAPKDSTTPPQRLAAAWKDTTFVDVRPGAINDSVVKGETYRYWVTGKTAARADSLIYASTDISIPDIGLSAQFVVTTHSSWPGYFSQGDSLHIALQYRLPVRRIRKVEWFDEENGALLHVRSDDSFEGRDTLKHRWKDDSLRNERQYVSQAETIVSGETIRLKVQLTDENSGKWIQRFDVFLIADSVRAFGGPDQRVSINQPIQLRGTAGRGFGYSVDWAWAWDCGGTGTWTEASDGSITLQAPSQAMESYTCIFRATDNRGATGYDTVQVRVDVPGYFLHQLPDINVDVFLGFYSGGKTVLVHGIRSPVHGSIDYKWSHGGDRWITEFRHDVRGILSSQFGMVGIDEEGNADLRDGPQVILPERIGAQQPYRVPNGGVIGPDIILACRNGSCYYMSTTGPPVETQDALLLTAIGEAGIYFKGRIAFLPKAGGVHPGIGDGLLYDPSTQTWDSLPPRTLGQAIKGLLESGECLYVIQADGQMEAYRPDLDAWEAKSGPGVAGATVFAVNGKIFAVSREGTVLNLSAYDSESDSWSLKMAESVPEGDFQGGVAGNAFYFRCGKKFHRIVFP